MPVHFGINFEFDRAVFDKIVEEHVENKKVGYICVVDGNNFSTAKRNQLHMEVLNGSIMNNCDSTWIAKILNWIHGTKYKHMNGPDLFLQYIKKQEYKHLFLGASKTVLDGLKTEMTKLDPAVADMHFEELPFREVNEFDYKDIAAMINEYAPDIIWVSLGAPKQEQFMYYLKPYLNQGVMFGVGAAFNFYSGQANAPKRAPEWMRRIGMEWVYRIFSEPKKQLKRNFIFLVDLPSAIREEIKKKNTFRREKNSMYNK